MALSLYLSLYLCQGRPFSSHSTRPTKPHLFITIITLPLKAYKQKVIHLSKNEAEYLYILVCHVCVDMMWIVSSLCKPLMRLLGPPMGPNLVDL